MAGKFEKFMNVWEIERNFKCPVVGAMLSVDKHKSILKKCGWDVNQMKPYEYHSHIMGCMGNENPVSVKVNNFIRHQARRYMKEVRALYECEDRDGVRDLWRRYSDQGEIGPVMFAIVSHRDADIDLLQDIHGEVHMLAHANMTEVFRIRKRLDQADQALVREKKKLAEKNARIRELVNGSKAGMRTIQEVTAKNTVLRSRLRNLESQGGADKDRALVARVRELEQALAESGEASQRVEREKRQLQIDLFSTQNENELVRKELQELVDSFSGVSGEMIVPGGSEKNEPCGVDCEGDGCCTGDCCPNYKLCARRIFMIGGITKMKAYYREIVEKAGGKFDYHDGYLKNSNANLEAKVRRCDVVVCPVSCNSHNACLKVKKLCNRYNKELKILNSASLSAVTQALMEPAVQVN